MREKGFSFKSHWARPADESIRATLMLKTQEYADRDKLGGFGPSRIPPRAASKLEPARVKIECGTSDFAKAKPSEPPAMVEVALGYPRYLTAPRAHSTLAMKRIGIDSYKGRICVRGDTAPLQTTAFVSPPTAHRCDVKLIFSVAAHLQREIHAVGVSHAFSQSRNLNPKDRAIAIPPPMIHLPWTAKLPR